MFARATFRPMPSLTNVRSSCQITRQPTLSRRHFTTSFEDRFKTAGKGTESWAERIKIHNKELIEQERSSARQAKLRKIDKELRYCFTAGGAISALSLYGTHHLYLDIAQSIPPDSWFQLALICCYFVCVLIICLCMLFFVVCTAFIGLFL